MGMYFMCPACKAANGPCTALNCAEVLKAVSAYYSGKPGPRKPIPALRYPEPFIRRIRRWWVTYLSRLIHKQS